MVAVAPYPAQIKAFGKNGLVFQILSCRYDQRTRARVKQKGHGGLCSAQGVVGDEGPQVRAFSSEKAPVKHSRGAGWLKVIAERQLLKRKHVQLSGLFR